MFTPSEAKRQLRKIWDAPIIRAVAEGIVRGRLSYFGLPGAGLEDIRDWRAHIGSVLALEKVSEDVPTLVSNGAVLNLNRFGFEVACGDLDDFVLNGTKDQASRLRATWFQLLNLDYCGGWIYKDSKGSSKRIRAFEGLIHLQHDAFFDHAGSPPPAKGYGLLLMTVNVRSDDGGEVPQYVRKQIAQPISDSALRQGVESLPDSGNEHWLLRYYVTHNVVDKMRANGFNVYVFPPFWYRSQKNSLVHFAFLFGLDRSVVGAGQTVQPHDTLLRLPLVTFGRAGLKQCVGVSDPLNLVRLLSKFRGLQYYIEEAVSLQRSGTL